MFSAGCLGKQQLPCISASGEVESVCHAEERKEPRRRDFVAALQQRPHRPGQGIPRGLDRCLVMARLQYSIAKYEVMEYADATGGMGKLHPLRGLTRSRGAGTTWHAQIE